MFKFIESFKIQDKSVPFLLWHQERINKTFHHFYKGEEPIQLKQILLDKNLPLERHKARLLYNQTHFKFAIEPYALRKINSIKLVEIEDYTYNYKFLDRSEIQQLKATTTADDIILCKNGCILDFSYANVALFKNNQWFTPTTYLLNGTARQRLIKNGQLDVIDICIDDLSSFEFISPINALLELGEIKTPLQKDLPIFL